MNKKFICAALAALITAQGAAALASNIPGHQGTGLENFELGTKKLAPAVRKYDDIFEEAGNQYGINPNILSAVCMQESAGVNYSYRADGTPYPAWGIMQIEYTHEKPFAEFGLDTTGEKWTLQDRLDPEKAIPYAAYLLSESLYKYNDDYVKMIQAYNFSDVVLDRIIKAVGNAWLDERINAASYADNWKYSSYGDPLYAEHVLAYFTNSLDYKGARVRLNNELIKFSDQHPIIENGTTLVPIRAISESLDADVDWNGESSTVTIDKDGVIISLKIGSDTGYVDGSPYELNMPAEIYNDRTMVPLRFAAKSLGFEVDWDGETRTVHIDEL